MRILIAPDSFKESMTAAEAAGAMARGVTSADRSIETDLCPIADGGDGTVEAMLTAAGGSRCTAEVQGPLSGMRVNATWGRGADSPRAIIELATAAGLSLVPHSRRNPLHTTTFGVGQLVRCAIDSGCTDIIIGLGGSSTCDGGCGLAQALGIQFELNDGRSLDTASDELMCGALLESIHAINRSAARELSSRGIRFTAARDVENPLFGPRGSAVVFAPQKGASTEDVRRLDRGLRHLASRVPETDPHQPGMGAAGGATFGIAALLGGTVQSGIELVLDAVRFDDRLASADVVLTGEGRLDEQTPDGKAVAGVARAAAARGVPVIAIVGDAAPSPEYWAQPTAPLRFTAVHTISSLGLSRDESLRNAPAHLARLAAEALHSFRRD